MQTPSSRALLPLLLLVLFSCAPRPPAPPTLPNVSPELLLGWLEDAGQRFPALTTLARTRVVTPERSRSFQQALLVAAPDRLRAEVLSPFGPPLLQVVGDGERLQVFIPGEGRCYAGAANRTNLDRFTRLPLTLPELVGLILQRVPFERGMCREASATDGRYLLTLADGEAAGVQQSFAFAPDGRLLRAAYSRTGQLELEAIYTPAPQVDAFPLALTLRLPQTGVEMRMTFAESETPRALPRERFLLQLPAGTPVLPFP